MLINLASVIFRDQTVRWWDCWRSEIALVHVILLSFLFDRRSIGTATFTQKFYCITIHGKKLNEVEYDGLIGAAITQTPKTHE